MAMSSSTMLFCTEVKEIITNVSRVSVAQVRPVRTLRRFMLLSPSRNAEPMTPIVLASAPATRPRRLRKSSRFSLNLLEKSSVMPPEISMMMKPSRIISEERTMAKAGWRTQRRTKTARKIAACAAICRRTSAWAKTSFSKKKAKGTSSARYQMMLMTASTILRRMTGWSSVA